MAGFCIILNPKARMGAGKLDRVSTNSGILLSKALRFVGFLSIVSHSLLIMDLPGCYKSKNSSNGNSIIGRVL